MDQIKLEEYARLIVDQGLNVKARQLVVISAPVEAKALVRAVSKAAFERHAGDVVVRYKDDVVEKERLEHADDAAFDHVPDYDALFFNETAKDGACYLSITGNDPDLMKGVDMTRLVEYRAKLREATKLQHDKLDHMEAQWCVAACATPGWAQKSVSRAVFPRRDRAALERDLRRVPRRTGKDERKLGAAQRLVCEKSRFAQRTRHRVLAL